MLNMRFDAGSPLIEGAAGPIPGLRVRVAVRADAVDLGQKQDPPPKYYLLGIDARLTLNGVSAGPVEMEQGPQFGGDEISFRNQEARWIARLPRQVIQAIESTRAHDVSIAFSAEFKFWTDARAWGRPYFASNASLNGELSAAKWIAILKAIGYSDFWVIEVERPTVEGWPRVVEFLDKASERLGVRDAEGAIAQCRAAWKALEPLLESEWAEIEPEVDRGSIPEDKWPKKSDRIKTLRGALVAWANTGDHPENYHATQEDALLAYRHTASLVAFLSKKATDAERRRKDR